MRPIERSVGVELVWRRTGILSRTHELLGDDGEKYASMTTEGPLSRRADVTLADHHIELRRLGIVRRKGWRSTTEARESGLAF